MRWEDERYIRMYTRDTMTWLTWPWQARALLAPLMRKLDRAGLVELGEHGEAGLAVMVGLPVDVVVAGLTALLSSKTFMLQGTTLVMPHFVDAQECAQTDAHRAREYRARARDLAAAADNKTDLLPDVTKRDDAVTKRDATITKSDATVTARHSASLCAVPCCAVPSKIPLSAKRQRAPKEPEVEVPGYKLVIDAYFAAFLVAKGSQPVFTTRMGKAAKSLLALMPVDEVCQAIRNAFADPWFVGNQCELWKIAQEPNRFRGNQPTSQTRLKAASEAKADVGYSRPPPEWQPPPRTEPPATLEQIRRLTERIGMSNG